MRIAIEPGKRLVVHRTAVRADWIDYNGHMNVAYYLLAFDQAADALFDAMGLDAAYRKRTGFSTFALECHICYLREVRAGDSLRFEVQMLDLDAKRFHYIALMHQDGEGYLAATAEWISSGVDIATRRTAPLPKEAQSGFAALLAAHRSLPRPEQVGRVIGIRRKGA